MKIVLITFLYEPELGGGAAQVVHSLAEGLAAQGETVTVITSAAVPRPITETKERVKIIRFRPKNLYWVSEKDKQHVFRKLVWQLVDLWNPWVYREVRGLLEAEQPDLIHVHKLRGISPSVWSAAKAVGRNLLVHTCHDYELFSPEGLLQGRVGIMAEKRALIMRPYQSFRAACSLQVQLASAPSQYLMGIHQKMGFFQNATCRVIPNSHGKPSNQLPKICPQSAIAQKSPLRLLYLGRLVPEKGVGLLCQTIKEIGKDGSRVVLDIAGWGHFEEQLRSLYGNCQGIHFHGAVFGESKDQLLRECDFLVLPSLVPESFGVVIPEAFAFGKPVLASRIGGIPELVREGETGFLVTPGDSRELAEAILSLADRPRRLEFMSEACRETALQYSSDTILQKYLDFYHESI